MSSPRGIGRKEFPLSVRKLAMKRCCRDGVPCCENCGMQIRGTPIYEHVTPAGLGGEPTLDNCSVRCRTCGDIKTFTDDVPTMAKADRVARKHLGLTGPKRKIQSAGFPPRKPQRTASRPIERRQP